MGFTGIQEGSVVWYGMDQASQLVSGPGRGCSLGEAGLLTLNCPTPWPEAHPQKHNNPHYLKKNFAIKQPTDIADSSGPLSYSPQSDKKTGYFDNVLTKRSLTTKKGRFRWGLATLGTLEKAFVYMHAFNWRHTHTHTPTHPRTHARTHAHNTFLLDGHNE